MPFKDPQIQKKYHREYYLRNKNRLDEYNRKWKENNPQKRKIITKKYRQTHPEKINALCRLYYKRNRHKHTERVKKYRRDNLIKSREHENQYRKDRRQWDICYKIKHSVSCQIRDKLKKRLINKNHQTTFSFLPYTIDDLIQHLESQFEPWMNWNNYGRKENCWSIDHIIPHSRFRYYSVRDNEFQKCWALDNLRPLRHIENVRRGDRVI